MAKWTKKAALERMNNNSELQAVCQQYPLAKYLVESAARLVWYEGYNVSSCHYAYKKWLWAAIPQGESTEYYVCLRVIDDLLPLEKAPSYYTNNPVLPGLPPFPPLPKTEMKQHFVLLSEMDIADENSEFNQRLTRERELLRKMLIEAQTASCKS